MLTRLGRSAAPGDAVDLLLECHQRIRSFLALSRRIAEAHDASSSEIAEAATRVRRYFTEALPLHARDEEDSVLPRLRGRDAAVDAALEAMAREHLEHERPLGVLVAGCQALSGDAGRRAELVPSISAATTELERHFAGHLQVEETVIFPAVRRLLDPAADREIVREIRARRGVVEPRPEPRLPTDAPGDAP
jgi:iron-sulfur cluster repair protein YtfE (RIC family)